MSFKRKLEIGIYNKCFNTCQVSILLGFIDFSGSQNRDSHQCELNACLNIVCGRCVW